MDSTILIALLMLRCNHWFLQTATLYRGLLEPSHLSMMERFSVNS